MRKIKSEFIERLIDSSSLSAVAGNYINLKSNGPGRFVACCPFHNEKTPSFYLDDKRGVYHCFGCGAKGNVIQFVKDYENVNFPQAIERIASITGMQVEYEEEEDNRSPAQRQADRVAAAQRKDDLQVLDEVTLLYQNQLFKSSLASDYLQQRGISQEMINFYRLGYAPQGNFLRNLAAQVAAKTIPEIAYQLQALNIPTTYDKQELLGGRKNSTEGKEGKQWGQMTDWTVAPTSRNVNQTAGVGLSKAEQTRHTTQETTISMEDFQLERDVFNVPYAWKSLLRTVQIDVSHNFEEAGYNPERDGFLVDHFYDTFRNRVMFPIIDLKGRVVGFGGRILQASGNQKYINSTNRSTVYNKSKELYGLYQVVTNHEKQRKKIERLVLVEGYLDVISMMQFGVGQGVAASGTAISPDQLRTIFRYTSTLVLCLDGDAPGRNAAYKSSLVALPLLTDDTTVTVAFLPNPEDPDSYLKKYGVDKFSAFLDNGVDIIRFLIEHTLAEIHAIDHDKVALAPINGKHTIDLETVTLTDVAYREFTNKVAEFYFYLTHNQQFDEDKNKCPNYVSNFVRLCSSLLKLSLNDTDFIFSQMMPKLRDEKKLQAERQARFEKRQQEENNYLTNGNNYQRQLSSGATTYNQHYGTRSYNNYSNQEQDTKQKSYRLHGSQVGYSQNPWQNGFPTETSLGSTNQPTQNNYQNNNLKGYQNNNLQGYQSNNQQGYQNNNRQGYRNKNNQQGYQHGYQNSRNNYPTNSQSLDNQRHNNHYQNSTYQGFNTDNDGNTPQPTASPWQNADNHNSWVNNTYTSQPTLQVDISDTPDVFAQETLTDTDIAQATKQLTQHTQQVVSNDATSYQTTREGRFRNTSQDKSYYQNSSSYGTSGRSPRIPSSVYRDLPDDSLLTRRQAELEFLQKQQRAVTSLDGIESDAERQRAYHEKIDQHTKARKVAQQRLNEPQFAQLKKLVLGKQDEQVTPTQDVPTTNLSSPITPDHPWAKLMASQATPKTNVSSYEQLLAELPARIQALPDKTLATQLAPLSPSKIEVFLHTLFKHGRRLVPIEQQLLADIIITKPKCAPVIKNKLFPRYYDFACERWFEFDAGNPPEAAVLFDHYGYLPPYDPSHMNQQQLRTYWEYLDTSLLTDTWQKSISAISNFTTGKHKQIMRTTSQGKVKFPPGLSAQLNDQRANLTNQQANAQSQVQLPPYLMRLHDLCLEDPNYQKLVWQRESFYFNNLQIFIHAIPATALYNKGYIENFYHATQHLESYIFSFFCLCLSNPLKVISEWARLPEWGDHRMPHSYIFADLKAMLANIAVEFEQAVQGKTEQLVAIRQKLALAKQYYEEVQENANKIKGMGKKASSALNTSLNKDVIEARYAYENLDYQANRIAKEISEQAVPNIRKMLTYIHQTYKLESIFSLQDVDEHIQYHFDTIDDEIIDKISKDALRCHRAMINMTHLFLTTYHQYINNAPLAIRFNTSCEQLIDQPPEPSLQDLVVQRQQLENLYPEQFTKSDNDELRLYAVNLAIENCPLYGLKNHDYYMLYKHFKIDSFVYFITALTPKLSIFVPYYQVYGINADEDFSDPNLHRQRYFRTLAEFRCVLVDQLKRKSTFPVKASVDPLVKQEVIQQQAQRRRGKQFV